MDFFFRLKQKYTKYYLLGSCMIDQVSQTTTLKIVFRRLFLFQAKNNVLDPCTCALYIIWAASSKKCCAKYAESRHPAHVQSLIRVFALRWNSLQYQVMTDLRTEKALIRLRGCIGWSWPSLSSYARRHVFALRDPNFKFLEPTCFTGTCRQMPFINFIPNRVNHKHI